MAFTALRGSLTVMDFEAVVEELFAAKREEFTALRDERAKQARPDRPLAGEITKLRKPTVAAWLVNQVSRAYPEEIDRLAELGESLRKAHQRLAGAELRTLSRQRHELIDMLAKRTQWLARKAGYPFSDATGRQIGETFEAAVSDPQALDAVRAARLSASLTPGAPEQWLTAAIMPVKSPPRATAKKKPAVKQKAPPSKVDRERERRRAAREKARKEAEDAAKAQDEAEQALSEAERAADEAATTVAELRGRLEEATQAEHEKRAEVTAARKIATAARRTAKAAERRAADLD